MRKFFKIVWRILISPFLLVWWVLRQIANFFRSVFKSLSLFWSDESEAEARSTTDLIGDLLESPKDMFPEILRQIMELRIHLFRGVIVLLLTTSLAFIFAQQVLEFFAQPIGGVKNIQAVEVTEAIGVFMRVSLLLGFTIASPYIIFELLLFIAPGLKVRERRIALASIPIITLLFIGGMAFSYFFMLNPALNVLIGFMDIPAKVRPASYYPFVTSLLFWIGISFEFPVVMLVLSWLRIIKAETLKKNTRIALVILAVMAAAITPTVDPVNMLLVWGPLVVLYFLGLGLAYLGEHARNRRELLDQRKNAA